MTIKQFFSALFGARPCTSPTPDDLRQFDEARKKLRSSGNMVVKALDAHVRETDDVFGAMVRDMRTGSRKKSCPPPKRKSSRKK